MSKKLLVTGFGDFPGSGENPSARLVEHLRSVFVGESQLQFHIFRTAYKSCGEDLDALFAGGEIGASLHFGLSHRARGFVLERVAHNSVATELPDADGFMPESGVINKNAPSCNTSVTDLVILQKMLLDQGVAASISDDAGRYLCNWLYFQVLAKGLENGCGQAPALFVHMPYFQGQKADNLKRNIKVESYLADKDLERGGEALTGAFLSMLKH